MSEELANKILRSLCANTQEEEDAALENHASVNYDLLHLSGTQKKLSARIRRYYNAYQGPPSTSALREEAARQAETEESLLAEELAVYETSWGANFAALIDQFLEEYNVAQLKEALQQTAQIATDGITEKGNTVRGVREASSFLMSKLVTLQKATDPSQRSMTNDSAVEFLHQEYVTRKLQPTLAYGLGTGFSLIDEATKGGQIGELWTVAGFISHGKSTFCLNWARYLAVEGGFNGLIFSLEMSKEQVWRVLATGHSAHPKFERDPLDYEKIKSGTLSPEDEIFYLNEVLPDLRSGEYGHLEVMTPTGKTTIEEVRAKAEVINRQYPLDFIIIDYIGLLRAPASNPKAAKNERINENLVLAKQMALEFDRGEGVLMITPHQINRSGFKEAQKNGGVYEIEALADANEAERSSDVVITVYQDKAFRQKSEAVITMLKNRDGRLVEPFNVFCPSSNRLMADLAAPTEQRRLDDILEA